MLRRIVFGVLTAGLIGGALLWIITNPQTVPMSALPPYNPDLENGRTMFFAGGCASCHAVPDQPDQTRLAGGRALKSQFGTFYAPNISPDRNDGIGAWSEADFVTAMVKGTSPDGRHYYPAFPYTSYQRMSYSDLRDLFRYLKTLDPVPGKVPEHDLMFPYNIRRMIGAWKFLYLDGLPFQPVPTRSAQWNRGAYLVNGPGHCAECHSPRNRLGAIVDQHRFAGGSLFEDNARVPNISRKRLEDWTASDFAYLLETGFTPDGDAVGSFMALVIRNTAQLSDQDRNAMAVYLETLPVVEEAKSSRKN
jgi:mono/diheme cytochrome c family protein